MCHADRLVSTLQGPPGYCWFRREITSDGGALLLRQLDREIGLIRTIARSLADARAARRCQHRAETMVRQRVFGLALGYEDLNDHHALRRDIALQTAVGTDGVLASQSTLCRFEQQASRQWALAIQEEIVEQFIRSFRRPPKKRLILDFDATDDPVHGEQLGRHCSGYDGYCFLPLYVFCGQQLLVSYLRPAYRDAAYHAGAILVLLVRRLRQAWPEVKIVFRGFNTRYVVTNLHGSPQWLYDSRYCPRVLREPPTLDGVIGGVIALFGVLVLLGQGDPRSLLALEVAKGDALMVVAAAARGESRRPC